MRYRDYWPVCAKRINTPMRVMDNRNAEIKGYADYAIAHKDTYMEIQNKTGVWWYHVAVIHRRENPSFNSYLGNGDPLSRSTTHVPAGRGPFPDFVSGALDALHLDGLDKVVPPWPIEKILYWCEVFNGAGYWNKGMPSPYIWGATNIQVRGKYVSDGPDGWSSTTWDTQPGCAAILWMLGHLDTSIDFTRES